jgi:hypothetical protein
VHAHCPPERATAGARPPRPARRAGWAALGPSPAFLRRGEGDGRAASAAAVPAAISAGTRPAAALRPVRAWSQSPPAGCAGAPTRETPRRPRRLAGSPARRESCAIVSACGCGGASVCDRVCLGVRDPLWGCALWGRGGSPGGLPPPPQHGRRGCVAAKSGADRGEARGARARRDVRRADGVRMRGSPPRASVFAADGAV